MVLKINLVLFKTLNENIEFKKINFLLVQNRPSSERLSALPWSPPGFCCGRTPYKVVDHESNYGEICRRPLHDLTSFPKAVVFPFIYCKRSWQFHTRLNPHCNGYAFEGWCASGFQSLPTGFSDLFDFKSQTFRL